MGGTSHCGKRTTVRSPDTDQSKLQILGHFHHEFLVEVEILVKNRGKLRRKFTSIEIRLLGLRDEHGLAFRQKGSAGKVDFPEVLLKTNLISRKGDYYFVEPEIEQAFTFVTKIPAETRYVLAHTKLVPELEKTGSSYENLFTEERLFETPSNSAAAMS